MVVLIAMTVWIEVRTKRGPKRAPLYLRVPARVTEVLLVCLSCILWPKSWGK